MHRTLSRGDKVFPALLAKAHWLANSLHSASPRFAQTCKPSQKGWRSLERTQCALTVLLGGAKRAVASAGLGVFSRDASLSNAVGELLNLLHL